jgi:hypothetical protein
MDLATSLQRQRGHMYASSETVTTACGSLLLNQFPALPVVGTIVAYGSYFDSDVGIMISRCNVVMQKWGTIDHFVLPRVSLP